MSISFFVACVIRHLQVGDLYTTDWIPKGTMEGDSSEDEGLGFGTTWGFDLGIAEADGLDVNLEDVVHDRTVGITPNVVDAGGDLGQAGLDDTQATTFPETKNGDSGSVQVLEQHLGVSSQKFERFHALLERMGWGPADGNVLRQIRKSLLRDPGPLIEIERCHVDQSSWSSTGASHQTLWVGEPSNVGEQMQHKRPKIIGDLQVCNCAGFGSAGSAASTLLSVAGQSTSPLMHFPLETQTHMCLNSVFNEDTSPMDFVGGHENHDGESCNFKLEDFELRMDLTDDLLHMVFSFLDHKNLCRSARVCRQWRAASAHEDFWRRLNFKDMKITPTQFADMCSRYPNATEVNILGTPNVELLAQKAVNSLRNLEVLILGRGQFNDAFFHSLVASCPLLTKLDITDSFLGNGIQETPVCHDRLRHLSMSKCRVVRISIRCPQLETLSLKRTNMTHAILGCPQLKELNIAFCNKLSDAGVRSVATSCPLLISLDVSNCSAVTDETLREISLTCPNLRVLDASYCPNISLESVRLPLLTDLNLRNCDGITSASMAALSYCYMLEALQLDCCSLLTSVNLDLPRLHNISLVHCRKFIDLNLRCPSLSSITVSNCPVLNRINITSNALEKLVLQKQESLVVLHLQCKVLQEVDLSECESLRNSICDVFSDGGGCPMLKSLVLDGCESLTNVGLRSSSLVCLSLISCRGMKSLELVCPNLHQVFLDGCDHLEDASFYPVGLRSLNLGICPKLISLRLEGPQMTLLELKGCGVLSQATISCPQLVSLDASFCSQLQDDCLSATAASCPYIESLILMSCPSVGPEGLSSLCRLPNLTILDLSYTFLVNLQPVFESCTQLKVLKLQACKYLLNSSLDSLHKDGALPALHELDLSYGSICQSVIEELLASCTHLTHVSLNGCASMHDLDWSTGDDQSFEFTSTEKSFQLFPDLEKDNKVIEESVRLLQNLNCVGCPNIKRVVIPRSAGCLHLISLNLSLSANLKEVKLSCSNLCFLNLSNCCSLEILSLDCPRLTSLLLQSSGIEELVLEDAVSHCTMLETLDIRFCPKITGVANLRSACPSLKRLFSSLCT